MPLGQAREGGSRRRPAKPGDLPSPKERRSRAGCPGPVRFRVAAPAWPARPPAPRESMLVGVRRLDDEAPTEFPEGAGAAVTVVVCETCRDASGSDAHPRPGALLAEATRQAAAGTRIATARVECLGNCKRRLSAAMLRPGAWSYVFGD